jgi:hypothetical protein
MNTTNNAKLTILKWVRDLRIFRDKKAIKSGKPLHPNRLKLQG